MQLQSLLGDIKVHIEESHSQRFATHLWSDDTYPPAVCYKFIEFASTILQDDLKRRVVNPFLGNLSNRPESPTPKIPPNYAQRKSCARSQDGDANYTAAHLYTLPFRVPEVSSTEH